MHVFLFSVLCGISPKSVSFCFILSHFPKRRSTVPDACESAYGVGGGHALHEPVPARRPKKGDAKVRTGVRRRSGRVTRARATRHRRRGMRGCVCGRDGGYAARPQARLPRPGANPARRDAMSRRTRQTAQPVHAVRAQSVLSPPSSIFIPSRRSPPVALGKSPVSSLAIKTGKGYIYNR